MRGMRGWTALVIALGACKDPSAPPPAAGSAEPTRPRAAAVGSAEVVSGSAPGAPAAAASLDPKQPVSVVRHHEKGQRYHLEMTHRGVVTETYDAQATVTAAGPTKFELAVIIKSLTTSAGTAIHDAALTAVVRPPRAGATSGITDAEQVSGPDVSMFLTPIEIMLGDMSWVPAEPHKPGDAWGQATSWKVVGYEQLDGRDVVHLAGSAASPDGFGETVDLRLSPADGFTGTAAITQTNTIGGSVNSQSYVLHVTPLPPAP